MEYYVRVDFPDEDRYAYVMHETGYLEGKVKVFYDLEAAESEAKKYKTATVIPSGNTNDTSGDK